MNKAIALASGLAMGGGLMYFFDPDRGRRRRALIKDKAVGAVNEVDHAMNKVSRDLQNRASGIVAEARSVLSGDEISDDVLLARVESKLGRLVSHPHAIEVAAKDGEITLRGMVLSSEVTHLVRGIASMRGVCSVKNHLEVHQKAENMPGLQGGDRRTVRRPDVPQADWPPATRFLLGAAGGALAVYGMTHRSLLAAGASILGTGMLARGIANQDISRLMKLERAA